MYLVNLLKECISHIEKGEFDPVLNDAINGLRVYVDEKTRNIEVAVAASASVTPKPSRSKKRKLTQTQHIHQDSSCTTNNKNCEETVIPDTQEDAVSSDISNKKPKTYINTIFPSSSSSSSLPQSQLFESEEVSWNQRLSEMKSYIQRNKGTLELDIDKMGPELFIWIYTQSTMYKSNLLSESRRSELANIDEFVMLCDAESGGFDTINNEVNNDNDMNHQSTNQELQLNNTIQPLEASTEIEEPDHEDNNISVTKLKPNSKDTSQGRPRSDDNWNDNLSKLKAYLRSFNTLEGMSSKMDKSLYGWVTIQKTYYRNTVKGKKNITLSHERMNQLNQIKEFVLFTKSDGSIQRKKREDDIWNENLLKIKAYLKSHNNTLEGVSSKMDKPLYTWVNRQKSLFKNTVEGKKNKPKLSQERMNKLNQIKEFVEYCKTSDQEVSDKTNNAKWSKNLEDLKAYLQRENKTNNEKDTMELNKDKMGEKLYSWVFGQRVLYRNTIDGRKSQQTLSQWRMDKLNEVKLFVKCCNDLVRRNKKSNNKWTRKKKTSSSSKKDASQDGTPQLTQK